MNIIEAYRYLEKGYRIKRKGWKEWSRLGTKEDGSSKIDITDQMLFCPEENMTTLICLEDVLANDWEVRKE